MLRRASILWGLVAACACPKPVTAPTGGGGAGGTGSAVAAAPTACADVRAHVEALYRADAEAHDPKRVADAVADNTELALGECAKDPAKRVPCLAAAATPHDVEAQCLAPLDDEGSEGDALAK